jgi:type III secretory pathway component EscV
MRVFLSHSSADKTLARRLAGDLRAASVDVWLDESEIRVGERFAQKIEQALEDVDFVIVLLTRASVASEWVDREWRQKVQHEGAAKRVAIIPVRAEPCEIPDFLAQRSHADISGGSYVLGLRHLLTILGHYGGDDALARPDARSERHGTEDMWWVVTPIGLEVSADLAHWFVTDSVGRSRALHDLAPAMRRALQDEFGFPFPGVRVAVNDVDLPPATAAIFVDEIPELVFNVAEGGDVAAETFAALHEVIRRMARWFVDIDTTYRLVADVEAMEPELVRRVVPARVSWFELTDVLRRLVDESIGVTDMRAILAALAPDAATGPERTATLDTVVLTERVRQALAPQITARFVTEARALRVLQLDPHIESLLTQAIERTPAGSYFNLAAEHTNEILASIRRVIGSFGNASTLPPIVVTNADIRIFVRRLVAFEFPALHVLSRQDIAAHTPVETAASITLGGVDGTADAATGLA